MEKIITLTQYLRNSIIDEYIKIRKEFLNDIDDDNGYEFIEDNDYDQEYFDEDDEETFDDENNLDEFINDETDEYEQKVDLKLFENIKTNNYKKLIFLIMLKDAYEYLKIQKEEKMIYEYELQLLSYLENNKLDMILNKIQNNNEFFSDIVLLFYIYNTESTKKKLEKKSNNSDNIEKIYSLKLFLLDDLEVELSKRRL